MSLACQPLWWDRLQSFDPEQNRKQRKCMNFSAQMHTESKHIHTGCEKNCRTLLLSPVYDPQSTSEKFHKLIWKSLGVKVSFGSLPIWDSLNPALILIHLLQCHVVGACETGLNESRFPGIYKSEWHMQSEPRPLTQVQPAVTLWAVRAGNVFT